MKIDMTSHELGLLRMILNERMIDSDEAGIPRDHSSSVFREQLCNKLEVGELEALREEAAR